MAIPCLDRREGFQGRLQHHSIQYLSAFSIILSMALKRRRKKPNLHRVRVSPGSVVIIIGWLLLFFAKVHKVLRHNSKTALKAPTLSETRYQELPNTTSWMPTFLERCQAG